MNTYKALILLLISGVASIEAITIQHVQNNSGEIATLKPYTTPPGKPHERYYEPADSYRVTGGAIHDIQLKDRGGLEIMTKKGVETLPAKETITTLLIAPDGSVTTT